MEQAQDFGAIAAGYTEWVLDRPLTVGLFQAFVDELAPQLGGRRGAKILYVASAAGEPAFTLARALPQATVYATDIAVEFVGLAEQRAVRQGLTNVVCQQADAERLAQFGDGSVDAVTCCMGLMFVPNVTEAFAAFRRVLRPGGVLVATVWQRDEAVPFFGALEELAAAIDPGWTAAGAQQQAGLEGQRQQEEGQQAPPSVPCWFGDPTPLLRAAEAAGFVAVDCRELRLAFSLAAEEWWECLWRLPDTPVKAALERALAAGRDMAACRRAAEQLLRQRGLVQPDGSILASDQMAWLLTARAPASH